MSELRQALGATLDVPAKKQAVPGGGNEGGDKPVAKDQPDELVYTDSSTFLKVWCPGIRYMYHLVKLCKMIFR